MLKRRPARSTSAHAAGFTLVELLVAMTILGIILGGIVMTLRSQQRLYSDAAEIMTMNQTLRQSVGILPADIRGITASGGDIYAMTDSSLDIRAATGVAIVCTIDPTRTIVTIPPLALSTGVALTAWANPPQSGDSLFVYDESAQISPSAGVWRIHALAADPAPNGSCPTTTGWTRTAAEAASGFTLTFSTALEPGVITGAPIRFFRRAKYKLFQAADNNWYIGYADCIATRVPPCGALQPLTGAALPYAAAGAPGNGTGLGFTYFDSAGTATAVATNVARVQVVARAQTSRQVGAIFGRGTSAYQDSIAVTVGIRNR
ncbi:MAG: hypothetical protein NVS4B6_22570 [Mycobacterium sp.]